MRHRENTRRCPTPLGVLLRGGLAGIAGTAAMDLLHYLRYRAGGGTDGATDYEFSVVTSWEEAPAPAQVARRIVEALFETKLPDESANLANNLVHWAYGVSWGASLGLLAGPTRSARPWWGPLFGTAVFLSGYLVLPATGLYRPIWEYDATTLAKDWAAHLVYGTATAGALRAVGGGRGATQVPRRADVRNTTTPEQVPKV